MAFGWEGKLVRLVPLDQERHLENAVRWMNDPEVTAWLLVGDLPVTRIAEADWFERMSKPGQSDVVFAIETLEGIHVGFSGVHGIDWRHGTAVTGTLIGDKDRWGQGLGTDAAIVRARWAFDIAGLRRLQSAILDGNERSYRMQMRAGYVECGRMPEKLWKCGRYRDEILTALSRERFHELHG